jgi:hypothetical protein
MATTPTPQPIPDLHFDARPVQVDGPNGSVIMVQVQVCVNFGVSLQLMLPPQIARSFGQYLRDAAHNADTTLVKPKAEVTLH